LREAIPDLERVRAFKLEKIRTLMTRFPKRSYVLVGDSGERDPEVYASILSEFPERVAAVFVRDVTGEDQTASRYTAQFKGGAARKLRVFRNPSELPPLRSMLGDDTRKEASHAEGRMQTAQQCAHRPAAGRTP
jgi:phosphatidate phosphatase APP1